MTANKTHHDILHRLSYPHSGKACWPWTIKSKTFPPTMPDGRAWPKISIVTPSFNQGKFIEETIRSVLLQGYPNLEYFIMDGGSTDDSIEIIKKYEAYLTFWVSEKDNGQADAVYRGFEKATGDIIAWINSDDYYLPDSFKKVAIEMAKNPANEVVIGGIQFINKNGKQLYRIKGFTQNTESLLCFGQNIAQPGCFWSRRAFYDVGGFERSLKFAFDFDLFLRLSKKYKLHALNEYIAVYREHGDSKSSTIWNEVGIKEVKMLQQQNGIDNIRDDEKIKIINKEKLRFLFNKCRSIKNILINPKLCISFLNMSVKFALNSLFLKKQ